MTVEPKKIRGLGISCANFKPLSSNSGSLTISSMWLKSIPQFINVSPSRASSVSHIYQCDNSDFEHRSCETKVIDSLFSTKEFIQKNQLFKTLCLKLEILYLKPSNEQFRHQNAEPFICSSNDCYSFFCSWKSKFDNFFVDLGNVCNDITQIDEKVDLINGLCDFVTFNWPNQSNRFEQRAMQAILEFEYILG